MVLRAAWLKKSTVSAMVSSLLGNVRGNASTLLAPGLFFSTRDKEYYILAKAYIRVLYIQSVL